MSCGINHQVCIKASPEKIYKALTETRKLAQWWTTDTSGSGATIGAPLNFGLLASAKIQCQGIETGKACRLEIPKGRGNGEWEETEVSFDLSTDEKQTFIQFRHSGWRESTEFQGHCSMRWAVFLLSLKDALERGKGRPYPYDLEVHYR